MLGSDRFAFETPNVIDPGDMPPMAPRRESRKNSGNSNTASTHDSDEDDDYREARSSTARLLRDIDDLDLEGDDRAISPNPYADEDENGNHHSLPSAEEARMHAAALLSDHNRRNKNTFGRTVRIDAPYRKNLVRKQMLRLSARIAPAVLCLFVVILIVAIVSSRKVSLQGSSGIGGNSTHLPDSDLVRREFNYIVKFLNEADVSSMHHLITEGTPQNSAAMWMARDDGGIPIKNPTNEFVDYRFVQRYVLAVFYFALDGPLWTKQANFLSPEHECSWFDSTFFDQFISHKYAVGVTCDPDKLQVRDIYLPHNELFGTLPTELMHLFHLQMFAVPNNNIAGAFPSQLKMLSHLSFLDVKYNDFSGRIPEWIGHMKNLEVLGLSNNQFTGSVPEVIGTMKHMHTLALDDNMLTGDLSFVDSLANLQFLYADRNFFSFTMQEDFLAGLGRLDELDLSSNEIKCSKLPKHFFSHPSLDVIDLANNKIEAEIPRDLSENLDLEYLSLRNNKMYGEVHGSIGSLKALTHLDIQNNTFTGSLPIELKQLSSLTYLAIGYNEFTEQQDIPPFLADLSSLRELSMPSMFLTGTIPGWLPKFMPKLKFLDFSRNKLKQTIPDELMKMTDLKFLLLHDNLLTGAVPAQAAAAVGSIEFFTTQGNPELTGVLNPICELGALVGYDCNVGVHCNCCPVCCDFENNKNCYKEDLEIALRTNEWMWEFNYDRSPFGFDPDIMDEAGLFNVVYTQPP